MNNGTSNVGILVRIYVWTNYESQISLLWKAKQD